MNDCFVYFSKFEAALRTNQGTDLLDVWTRYIAWVEQTYPNGGKEGNLSTLLEKCINEFKDDQINCQDERYFDVWIKYVSIAEKPLVLFDFMEKHNLFTKLPEFYINWSWHLEQSGNFKKADQVFNAGVEKVDRSNPKFETLEIKHRQFQARVMKRMVDTNSISNEPPVSSGEEERAVLGSLQGHGKHQKVGSMRIGSAKKSDQPGILPLSSHNASSAQLKSRPGFAIYHDNENKDPRSSVPAMAAPHNFPFAKEQNRENELNAGKWTKSNIAKKRNTIPLDKIDAAPQFAVHQDEGLEQPSGPTPHKLQPLESNVLSARKVENDDDQKDVAVALFEPYDPTKRPMYCKHLVYQGTTEFSFEEIRGAKWKKKREEQEVKLRHEEMAIMIKEIETKKELMNKQQEEICAKQERMDKQQQEIRAEQERFKREQEEAFNKQQEEIRAEKFKIQEEFRKFREAMEKQR